MKSKTYGLPGLLPIRFLISGFTPTRASSNDLHKYDKQNLAHMLQNYINSLQVRKIKFGCAYSLKCAYRTS